MQQTQTLLGQIAAILAVAQVIPYVWSILKGRTRPSRASYAIWSVVQTVGLASYLAAGATTTKWVPVVLTINAIIIFGLSLKFGVGGLNKFDVPCLLLAGVALVMWAITNNPAVAVYMSTLAGCVGYLPTIKKAYVWPRSENTLSWTMYAAATVLNLFALTTIAPVIALPLAIEFILSATMAGLLIFPRWKFRGASRHQRPMRMRQAS